MLSSGTEKWHKSGLWPGVLDQRNPGGKKQVERPEPRSCAQRFSRIHREAFILWGRALTASLARDTGALLHVAAGS